MNQGMSYKTGWKLRLNCKMIDDYMRLDEASNDF